MERYRDLLVVYPSRFVCGCCLFFSSERLRVAGCATPATKMPSSQRRTPCSSRSLPPAPGRPRRRLPGSGPSPRAHRPTERFFFERQKMSFELLRRSKRLAAAHRAALSTASIGSFPASSLSQFQSLSLSWLITSLARRCRQTIANGARSRKDRLHIGKINYRLYRRTIPTTGHKTYR